MLAPPQRSQCMILTGDCRTVLKTLPPKSIHCCVTSPPYFGLRDYGTASWSGGDPACDHKPPDEAGQTTKPTAGQREHVGRFAGKNCHRCGAERIDAHMGLEQTPDAYVTELVAVFREIHRTLRDDGTCWLNLGDSYAHGGNGSRDVERWPKQSRNDHRVEHAKKTNLAPKNLLGIPWRVAFSLQADGWYLRQDIIWHKPNPMPESVTDRCTKAHEYIFLLTKSEKYFFDTNAVAEPLAASSIARLAQANLANQEGSYRVPGKTNGPMKAVRAKGNRKTFRGGGVYTQGQAFDNSSKAKNDSVGNAPNVRDTRNRRSVWTVATTPFKEAHFATFPPALIEPCILAGCPINGIVLDPFGGAGTTGLVAAQTGRRSILIELNPAYAEMARRRIGNVPHK